MQKQKDRLFFAQTLVKGFTLAKDIKVWCACTNMKMIEEITPNKRNTNKHSPKQIDLIAHSLKENGWRRPILVGAVSNTIIAGEGRYLAAKKLGLKYVPVDFQAFASELAEYKYLESDNNTTKSSEWDEDKFKINLNEFELNLDDVTLEDFGLLDAPKLPPEEKITDKEIDETTLKTEHECPSCGYLW